MKRKNRRNCGNKTRSLIRHRKIQYRLLAVFLLISLLPTICIGMYAYRVYTRAINSKISESALQTVRSLNTNMTIELEKFQDYCATLSVADAVQNSLQQTSAGQDISRDMVLSIRDLSVNIPFQSIYLKNLRIVSLDGTPIYDRGYDGIPYEKSEQLLAVIDKTAPKDSLQFIHTYRSQDKLVLGRKLYSATLGGEPVGYIMVYINEALFEEKIFADVTFGPESNIMLVDEHGSILSSQDRSLLGKNIADTELFGELEANIALGKHTFNINENGQSDVVIAMYNNNFGCYLVANIPGSYITKEAESINTALFWIAAALILLSLILTFIVYVSIVSPIRNIVAACNITSDEDLNVHINDPTKDELGFLSRTIDQMVDEIQLLMDRRQADQVRRRELELEALQYQINPHFLFNTLNSFQWLAVINDVPVVAEGISSLSALLRSTIMKTDEFVPLSEELENLSNYFTVQKIRYGNSFDVCYEIDSKTKSQLLPRFVLQPLAENAIIHGTENMPESIMITVSSTLDGHGNMVIEIRDNGCGFSVFPGTRGKERFSGIGVNNVVERLHICYGTDDRLQISSQPGKGTICRITIPLLDQKENE